MKINYNQNGENPTRAIIALHGWTGDEHSMVPLAKSLHIENTKWYIPRAPYESDSGKGFTWFAGNEKIGWEYDKTFTLTKKVIQQVLHDGFAPKNIYLIGFSMGAGLSYHVALRLGFSIGGIIPIAGFMKNPKKLFANASDESRNTPILILHGTKDDIVKPEMSDSAYEYLINQGYSVKIEKYDAVHKIPVEAHTFIKEFIQK